MSPVGQEKPGRMGVLIGAAMVTYFLVALEIIIMVSPFALVFYSVVHPILDGLARSPSTRWLTAFFLPHLLMPPTRLLARLRVLGSGFFIGGSLVFLVCAGQVYLGKLLNWGVATRGCYRLVRHPQYAGLALAGAGLTILWPRFLTLVLLGLMLFLYYLLAYDEECRMLSRYGETYKQYRDRTGMFWPRLSTRPTPLHPLRVQTALLVLAALFGGAIAIGFGLRAYTVAHLPLARLGQIDVITLIRAELALAQEVLSDVTANVRVAERLRLMGGDNTTRVLAYMLPVDYVMQGLIANTGEEWQLFRRHQTVWMITDNLLHPFAHIQRRPMQHHGMTRAPTSHDEQIMQRRVIFLEIRADHPLTTPQTDFAINNERTPRFFVDVQVHTHELLQLKDTPSGHEWGGGLPMPTF